MIIFGYLLCIKTYFFVIHIQNSAFVINVLLNIKVSFLFAFPHQSRNFYAKTNACISRINQFFFVYNNKANAYISNNLQSPGIYEIFVIDFILVTLSSMLLIVIISPENIIRFSKLIDPFDLSHEYSYLLLET